MRLRYNEDVNSSTYLNVEGASNGRSNQTTPITSGNDRRALPESPPPPYITPPGTILRNVNLASLSASMKQICPVRRTWLRRSAQYPQSSSGNHPLLGGPTSFTNVETFRTYGTDCVASDTSRQSENFSKEVRIAYEIPVQEDTTVVLEENNQYVSEEDYDEINK